MRIRNIFSVFGRKLPSGKIVYYYQCYDENGKRQCARSTGITKKTEAVAACMKLYKEGMLIPKQKLPTFGEFSKGWWNAETCRYLKWRQLYEPVAPATILIHRRNFKHHIKNHFEKYALDEITREIIETWLLTMKKKHIMNNTAGGKNFLKAKTINLALGTLKLMLGEAVREKFLKINPCAGIKKLKAEDVKRDILTLEEVKRLFPADWPSIWDSKTVYRAHRLAVCTGLRIGELRGLRSEYIFDDYIHITGQYTRFGYVGYTKTKHNRNVPITAQIRQELEELLTSDKPGFVFSEDSGQTPISIDRIARGLDRALERIGIPHEEKLKRSISFHTWRHFFNTQLRMSNIADSKVQSITGHLSLNMTNHYTHFDTRKFTEVREVQTKLLTK